MKLLVGLGRVWLGSLVYKLGPCGQAVLIMDLVDGYILGVLHLVLLEHNRCWC